jgi:hypothetical protein
MTESERRDTPNRRSFAPTAANGLPRIIRASRAVRLPISALEIMSREQMDYLQHGRSRPTTRA